MNAVVPVKVTYTPFDRAMLAFHGLTMLLQYLIIGAILFAVMFGTSQALFGWPR